MEERTGEREDGNFVKENDHKISRASHVLIFLLIVQLQKMLFTLTQKTFSKTNFEKISKCRSEMFLT